MAVVRSPDFLRALIREIALATLIHQRRLTPSCGGQAPTAERTVGPARMIAESLTPKPGIREHNRHKAAVRCAASTWSVLGQSGHFMSAGAAEGSRGRASTLPFAVAHRSGLWVISWVKE